MEENFLKRWSRLKHGTRAALDTVPVASSTSTAPSLPETPLPALDKLEFSSDFTAFMQADVDEKLRKAALQKLFHNDHFHVMDGLDVYVDDYNSFEPIDAELLQNLKQARGLLFADEPPNEPAAEPAAGEAAPAGDAADADPISQETPTIGRAKDESA